MKFFFRYLKYYKRDAVTAPLFKLLEACFDLFVPLVVAYIIDYGIGSVSGQTDMAIVIRMCILLVALGIVGLVCSLIAQYCAARAAVGCAARVRHDLFTHMQCFSYTDTDRTGTSTMITRITSDVNQFQSGINMTLRLLLRSPVIVIGAVIISYTINPRIAWIFAVAVPLLAVVVFAVIIADIPLFRKIQGGLDKVTAGTRATLNGVRVVRAFGMEKRQCDEFDEVNTRHASMQKFAGRITALMNPLTYVIINSAIIAILYFGNINVSTGNATQGQIIALINLMSQILVELIKLANTIFTVTKATACANRIRDVLDSPAGEKISPPGLTDNNTHDGCGYAVSYNKVSLKYEKAAAPSLTDISFDVRPGMTVGIIGGTGSGKTSLINLIPHFYDAYEGEVRVFGKPVKDYPLDSLRSLIGIVPQKAVLFHGTIRSNLLWGFPDADDNMLWNALSLAQADDFVRKKDGMLDATVEQGGRNFSGGQRQRLTIARALVRRPEILILDDSASALDLATDAKLRHALRSLDYNPTVFIISQRTATISHSDMIIVLDEGNMIGIGTHDSLLKDCPVYREIYESQFKGGENA